MLPGERFRDKLLQIEGKGYPAYKDLAGAYRFPLYVLYVDHVQADPFAPPSRMRVRVDMAEAQFPPDLWSTRVRRIALEDYVARRFNQAIRRHVKGRRGAGHSGMIAVDAGGQEILERTACRIEEEWVEVRFGVGLPAEGRKAVARQASAMLLDELPTLVEEAMRFAAGDPAHARGHVEAAEDHAALQAALASHGLVAFVADGSLLPRESGPSDRPLRGRVVPFESPPDLRVTLTAPNAGPVGGMGIPAGITVIVGGGFHGKSTLLRAIERGVYPHVPGDGRERVVAVPDAVSIRAEDGRRIEGVDLSPFIGRLPLGGDARRFSTENASGSTSQAANVIEALEAGARLFLIDEDTAATNLMLRDDLMQRLVPRAAEPITPFLDRAEQLRDEHGVSTILAAGGSGDYLAIADAVVMMEAYRPRVVTEQARALVRERGARRVPEAGGPFGPVPPRAPLPSSFAPIRDRRAETRGPRTLSFGREHVDLGAISQLVDESQTRAIGEAIRYAVESGLADGARTLREILDAIDQAIEAGGVAVLSPFKEGHPGAYARPRRHEIAAAINRLRSLRVRRAGEPLPKERAEHVQHDVGREVGEHRGDEAAAPVQPPEDEAAGAV